MIVRHNLQKVLRVNDDISYNIVVDQRAGADACLNRFGWPANEITLLMKLQQENPDSPLVNHLERSLFELPTPQVDNSGKSDSQIISEVIPKYVGTLSEYLKWVETLPLTDSERFALDEQAKSQFGDSTDEELQGSSEGVSS